MKHFLRCIGLTIATMTTPALSVADDTMDIGDAVLFEDADQAFLTSQNGTFNAAITQCKLIVAGAVSGGPWLPVWQSQNFRSASDNRCMLEFQRHTGNLILMDGTRNTVWNTGLRHKSGMPRKLIMQNDGRLVLYENSRELWSSARPKRTITKPAIRTFIRVPDAAIAGYNNKRLKDVSPDECMKACRRSTAFECQSFDYYNKQRQCDLSAAAATGKIKLSFNDGTYDHYSWTPIRVPERPNKPKPIVSTIPKQSESVAIAIPPYKAEYGISIDCDVGGGASDESTKNRIGLRWFSARDQQIMAGNITADSCWPFDPAGSVTLTQKPAYITIETNGSDAFLIDHIEFTVDGEVVKTFGENDDKGWCLSTDPNDSGGEWAKHTFGKKCQTKIKIKY